MTDEPKRQAIVVSGKERLSAGSAAPEGKPSWGDHVLFVFGLIALVASVFIFGWRKQPAELAVAAGAALFCMAFARRREFTLVKAAGVELRLREAQKAVAEAQATAEQLRAVAAALSKVALTELAYAGVFGTVKSTDKLALKKGVDDALAAVGLSTHEIQELGAPVTKMIRFQHVNMISTILAQLAGRTDTPNKKMFEASVLTRDLLDFTTLMAPSAAMLRHVLAQREIEHTEVAEALADYEHFEAHGSLRRPEVFLRLRQEDEE